MNKIIEKQFNIGELKGISKKNIEEHLKLYSMYVKNANLVLEKIEEYKIDKDKNTYILGELHRRFSFEYNGIRNHEFYFSCLEGGNNNINDESLLKKQIEKQFSSFSEWLSSFKDMAGNTRGIGWAVLYYDKENETLINSWIDEQHLGHLNSLKPILMLDMWEHSYILDYLPSGKKKYIEDFFENINWNVIEENFKK